MGLKVHILNHMVKYSPQSLNEVFGALSDPTRRAILLRLREGELPVTELAAPFRASLPAISKHLSVLESAGLISRRSVGRQKICSILPGALEPASEWLDQQTQFWNDRLDSLDVFLNSVQEEDS